MTHGDPTGLLGLNGCHVSRKNWGMLKSSGISGHSPCTERNSWIAEAGAIWACRLLGLGGMKEVDGVDRNTLDSAGVRHKFRPTCSRVLYRRLL